MFSVTVAVSPSLSVIVATSLMNPSVAIEIGSLARRVAKSAIARSESSRVQSTSSFCTQESDHSKKATAMRPCRLDFSAFKNSGEVRACT